MRPDINGVLLKKYVEDVHNIYGGFFAVKKLKGKKQKEQTKSDPDADYINGLLCA